MAKRRSGWVGVAVHDDINTGEWFIETVMGKIVEADSSE